MDPNIGFDTSNLDALREELGRLNRSAVQSGLVSPRDVWPDQTSISAPGRRPSKGSADKGKAGSRRLLAMLRRAATDDSPNVPGTRFTEAGVVRLLAHLNRSRSKRKVGYLQRLRRFLTRPVPSGMHLSAGISVERLQQVSRFLQEVEAFGWQHARTVRAVRRGRQAPPPRSRKRAAKRAGQPVPTTAAPVSE